jgi:hypothetical protein
MNPEQAPLMDKEAADWPAWYLGVIEQGEHRDEGIEAALRQTIEEYRARVAKEHKPGQGEG